MEGGSSCNEVDSAPCYIEGKPSRVAEYVKSRSTDIFLYESPEEMYSSRVNLGFHFLLFSGHDAWGI